MHDIILLSTGHGGERGKVILMSTGLRERTLMSTGPGSERSPCCLLGLR